MKKNERFVAYGGCYGLLLLAAFLLQLKWQGYICCSIVFVLVMWRMDKVLKEEKKQQTRLQEAGSFEKAKTAFLYGADAVCIFAESENLICTGDSLCIV